MKAFISLICMLCLSPAPLLAAGPVASRQADPLHTPRLSEPLATARFFDTDRFLTNAGISYQANPELNVEPELGIGYRGRDRELQGGVEQATHLLHARAGGRLSLADTLYFSAAAKLPVLTVASVGLSEGEELGTRPGAGARAAYDLGGGLPSALSWTGELGIRLSPQIDLTLYYDQSPLSGWSSGPLRQEERIGTRFIIRFK